MTNTPLPESKVGRTASGAWNVESLRWAQLVITVPIEVGNLDISATVARAAMQDAAYRFWEIEQSGVSDLRDRIDRRGEGAVSIRHASGKTVASWRLENLPTENTAVSHDWKDAKPGDVLRDLNRAQRWLDKAMAVTAARTLLLSGVGDYLAIWKEEISADFEGEYEDDGPFWQGIAGYALMVAGGVA